MIRRPPRSTLSSSSAASDVYKRQVPYHVCTSVLWVLDGKDCTPGCDLLHQHPLLSREFTCTYSLKVPERTNMRESSEELVHTIVLGLPRARPNTTMQLVPLCYPILTPVPAVVL